VQLADTENSLKPFTKISFSDLKIGRVDRHLLLFRAACRVEISQPAVIELLKTVRNYIF